MLGSAIIAFREVLEAALVLGIVLAASSGVAGARRWIAAGVAAGVLGALLLAGGARSVASAFEGVGQCDECNHAVVAWDIAFWKG